MESDYGKSILEEIHCKIWLQKNLEKILEIHRKSHCENYHGTAYKFDKDYFIKLLQEENLLLK